MEILVLCIAFGASIVGAICGIGGVFCALAFLVFFRCKKKSYYAIMLTMAVAIWVVFRFVLGVDF